jgi:hypothetical protein
MSATQSKGCEQDIVCAHWQGQLSKKGGKMMSGGTDEF